MKTTVEKLAAALENFPEELREPAVAYCSPKPRNFVPSKAKSQREWMILPQAVSPFGMLRNFCAKRELLGRNKIRTQNSSDE